jgi:hypothetical protein
MSFKDIAIPIAVLGVPVIRLNPRSKVPSDKNWPDLATTDIDTIFAWDKKSPDANCGSVAKPEGFLFFESDEPGILERYQKETGQLFKTFTVQSRPGRYHFYLKQTDLSRQTGSISQKDLKFGSLRQNNAFVVSPGSIHPESGQPYLIVDDSPIVAAPEALLKWLISQKPTTRTPASLVGDKIPRGSHDIELTRIAGKLRRDGMEEESISAALIEVCEKRCEGYGSDYQQMCRKIANSVCKYAVPLGADLTIGGKIPGDAPPQQITNSPQTTTNSPITIPASESLEVASVEEVVNEYPFWCWNGTLYEDFAELCGDGNLIPKEYFIESIKTVIGAICGHRILPNKMPGQEARFYTILLSAHGGIGKSSAVNWARDMFIGTGLLYDLSQDGPGKYQNIGCAQGGFASGSGLITNGFARHDRILQHYDEVTALIEKFGITGSGDAFLDATNTLFESGFPPGNVIRGSKVKEMPSRPVHNSILGCSVFEKWNSAFVKTNSENSGFFQRLNIVSSRSDERVPNLTSPDLTEIKERFLKKIQPLEFQLVQVNRTDESIKRLTEWHREKRDEWKNYSSDVRGRIEVMIHRNASHIAWLMSGDDVVPSPERASDPIHVECDEDIMSRALALAEYQVLSRHSHQPAIGNNEWALIENLIKNKVYERKRLTRADLYRDIRADKFGITAFNRAIDNLTQEGIIAIGSREGETKRGRKTQIVMWINE